jgi:hypothetical protein
MTDILIKKWKEVEMEANTRMGGEWKVEIVHPNGGVEAPFGDKMRKNLIVNRGIDLLLGHAASFPVYDGSDGSMIIPNVIRGAQLGASSTAASVSQTGILTALTNSQTMTTTTSTQTCTITDDTTVAAGRTFTRIYDFTIANTSTPINEAIIHSGGQILSRFVFPTTITLITGQFLRLTYSFKAYVDSMLNPITVVVNNGGFIGDGQLKLVGTYQNIFGTMTSLGVPDKTLTCGGHSRVLGWLAAANQYDNYPANTFAHMIPSGIAFPAVNTALGAYTRVGSTIFTNSPGMAFGSYTSGQGYQDITYIFPAANPSSTTNIGGILFSSTINGTGTSAPANAVYGWYWKFSADQSKNAAYSLAVNLRQSVTAI